MILLSVLSHIDFGHFVPIASWDWSAFFAGCCGPPGFAEDSVAIKKISFIKKYNDLKNSKVMKSSSRPK
jgi:hypothetical protein